MLLVPALQFPQALQFCEVVAAFGELGNGLLQATLVERLVVFLPGNDAPELAAAKRAGIECRVLCCHG